ncbi:hypothetical protein B0187_02520 [Haemophilus paracuniculus]|uniref:DUF4407 domain-containing protein n=1 Tax=Haemophilus paracuniculus TaxID=734 RepID=A0A1T0ATM3_9PAST|nr:hypothetical protein [Haemophilus paracuniculus]OOR99705.1 hypothetical protein B0187_02520 [Haemophilus paracuniculus]
MKPTTRKLPGWVYIPLTVFMAISFYQTAKGFTDLFGTEMAWGFSLAITMLMYGCTALVGYRRINKLPILAFVLMYAIFFLPSFTGNFNAIYTNYQEPRLLTDEVLRHKQKLDDVVNASEKAFKNFSPEITEKRARVESLTEQLVRQITDPARPGLGKRALEIIAEIEAVLGERLTEFGTRGGNWNAIADRYRENIDQVMKRKLTSADYGQLETKEKQIADLKAETDEKIQEYLGYSNAQKVKDEGKKVIADIIENINKIGSITQEFIKNPSIFKFEKAKFENQDTGKIVFSFKSAFTEQPLIAFILAIVCFLIDWLVMLCLIVFFGRNEKEPMKPINSGRAL